MDNGDSLDHASDLEMMHREQALANLRNRVEMPADFEAPYCYSCDAEIPAGRLKLGYWTCIQCQEKLELRSKFYRK